MQNSQTLRAMEMGTRIFGRDPQKPFPFPKIRVWYINRQGASTNATCRRDEESKKEKKVGNVTSRLFAQTTHVELPLPTLSCGVGSRT